MKQIIFNDNKNIVSEKIKEYRKKQKITQSELAARMQTMGVNIDQQAISRIEKNLRQVTDYELACFCVCLDITPNIILSDLGKYFDGVV